MTLLPVLLLGAGALVVWVTRRRHARVSWIFTAGTALLVWITTLALVLAIPRVINLSVWRPVALFDAHLDLHLDRVGWSFLYLAATVLLSLIFTEPIQVDAATPGSRSLFLAYAAFPFMAILAGNLLTIATTWALMDLLSFTLFISVEETRNSISRFIARLTVDGSGVVLIISASYVNYFLGSSSSQITPSMTPIVVLLLAIAAFLRLGLLPLRFSLSPLPSTLRGIDSIIRLFPPLVALSVLARIMDVGVPAGALPWLELIGGVFIVVGGVRWVIDADGLKGLPFFFLAVTGLGVFTASLRPESGGNVMIAASSLLVLVGAVITLFEPYSPIHRLWPGLAALMVTGMPGMPGYVILSALANEILEGSNLFVAILGIVGLVLLGLGALRLAFRPSKQWQSSESLARVVYSLGLALPILVGVGFNFYLPRSLSISAVTLFLVTISLTVVAFIWMRGLHPGSIDRWGRLFVWLDPSPIYRIVAAGGRSLMRIIRGAGDILEGEGAVLWVIVILLLLFLGLRNVA